jgi:hypothetical protein
MADYAKEYGANFFISFLSLEEDSSMGIVIIELCRSYEHDTVIKVLAKYAELVAASENVEDYISENITQNNVVDDEIGNKAQGNLLSKARLFLRNIAENVVEEDLLLSRLESYKGGLELYKSVLETLKKTGAGIESKDLKSIHFEVISGSDIVHDQALKNQLLEISDANWLSRGEKGAKVAERFRNLLESPEKLEATTVFVVSHEDEVIGFFLQDSLPDGSTYCGSLNTRKEVASTDIGSTLMDTVMVSAMDGQQAWARCNPQEIISKKLINQLGFNVVGFRDDAAPSDTFVLERDTRPDREEFKSSLKGLSYQELAALEPIYTRGSDKQIFHYIFPDEYQVFTAEAAIQFQDPQVVLTAFQPEAYKKKGQYTVAVGFERFSLSRAVIPDSVMDPEQSSTEHRKVSYASGLQERPQPVHQ